MAGWVVVKRKIPSPYRDSNPRSTSPYNKLELRLEDTGNRYSDELVGREKERDREREREQRSDRHEL
jgi:hypothetical protein